jgi:hypothetical protein
VFVRFEGLTAVALKNTVFSDVTPCDVRTDVSEEHIASFITTKRNIELETTLMVN